MNTPSVDSGQNATSVKGVAYIKSKSGILRILEVLLCLITFICSVTACGWCQKSELSGTCGWSSFASFTGLLLALVYLIIYIRGTTPNTRNLRIESLLFFLWTVFLLLAGTVLLVLVFLANEASVCGKIYIENLYVCHQIENSSAAATCFAFATAIAFAIQFYLLYRQWRAMLTPEQRQEFDNATYAP